MRNGRYFISMFDRRPFRPDGCEAYNGLNGKTWNINFESFWGYKFRFLNTTVCWLNFNVSWLITFRSNMSWLKIYQFQKNNTGPFYKKLQVFHLHSLSSQPSNLNPKLDRQSHLMPSTSQSLTSKWLIISFIAGRNDLKRRKSDGTAPRSESHQKETAH